MSLANGRHYLAIPGPSVMPDRVLQAMHRPAPNIYTGQLVDMVAGLVPDLKAVARTEGHVAMYIANGHGAWEAAICNTLSRGDRILVLGTGRFCLGWGEMAAAMGVDCQIIDFGQRSDIDMARVAEALAADREHRIKAVMAVQVDTSTSVKNDIRDLRRALDAIDHPALLFADCIACLACDEFPHGRLGRRRDGHRQPEGPDDAPGMGFVFFNDKADGARTHANLVTPYWDWRPRMRARGVLPLLQRHRADASPLWVARRARHDPEGRGAGERLAPPRGAGARRLGRAGGLGTGRPRAPQHRRAGQAQPLRDHGEFRPRQRQAHPRLDDGDRRRDPRHPAGRRGGAGRRCADYLRIGHMGHVNAHMVMGVLGSLQAGMTALGIPHGPTGLEAAAKVIAEG
jgi:alanine-glyoxylate transaminase/serine-glyoxylate transaminase/serine-pyruvate transaminase